MTPDRRNLLETVWALLYKQTCPCGRCDCVSSDPIEIARRVFVHWSVRFREMAASQARLAEGVKAIADKGARKLRREERKRGCAPSFDEWRAQLYRLRAESAAYARRSAWCARAATRYERLARGRHPFAAEPETQPCTDCGVRKESA